MRSIGYAASLMKTGKNHNEELAIEALSKDGFGLAKATRPSGASYRVEVPFTMPGDRVLANVSGRRRSVCAGRLQQILSPAAERISARCIHFGVCGGCRWQHFAYEAQLKLKAERLQQLFAPLTSPETQLYSILGCVPPWHYRNKMEFSFSADFRGERYLGLMMAGGRGHVLNISECHLVDGWMLEALEATRIWWSKSGLDAYHPYRNTGALRTLTLRDGLHSGDRLAMLTVSGEPAYAMGESSLQSWVESLRTRIQPSNSGSTLSLFLRIQQIAKGRPTQFYEMLLHGPDHIREELQIAAIPEKSRKVAFHISPTAFFQPNPRQAELLYSRALQLVVLSPEMTVCDLYCGTGTLGVAVSPYVKKVVGIELSAETALDARTNAALNQCENVTIVAADVGQISRQRRQELGMECPGLVMVDPPRVGLTPLGVQQLLDLQPTQILYISCNPTTQAQDIGELQKGGYTLCGLQAIDQFPQTIHVENIAVLRRH